MLQKLKIGNSNFQRYRKALRSGNCGAYSLRFSLRNNATAFGGLTSKLWGCWIQGLVIVPLGFVFQKLLLGSCKPPPESRSESEKHEICFRSKKQLQPPQSGQLGSAGLCLMRCAPIDCRIRDHFIVAIGATAKELAFSPRPLFLSYTFCLLLCSSTLSSAPINKSRAKWVRSGPTLHASYSLKASAASSRSFSCTGFPFNKYYLTCHACVYLYKSYIFFTVSQSLSLSLLLHLFSLFWYNHSDQLPKFETKAGAQQPQQLTSEFSIVFSCASGGSILRPCETGRLLFCRQFSESLWNFCCFLPSTRLPAFQSFQSFPWITSAFYFGIGLSGAQQCGFMP